VPIVDLQTQLEGSFLYLIVLVAILFTCGWLTVILNISIPARFLTSYLSKAMCTSITLRCLARRRRRRNGGGGGGSGSGSGNDDAEAQPIAEDNVQSPSQSQPDSLQSNYPLVHQQMPHQSQQHLQHPRDPPPSPPTDADPRGNQNVFGQANYPREHQEGESIEMTERPPQQSQQHQDEHRGGAVVGVGSHPLVAFSTVSLLILMVLTGGVDCQDARVSVIAS
jgi:hypothetical protein